MPPTTAGKRHMRPATQTLWKEKIKLLFTLHKFRYGYRKITVLLRAEITISHKRVQRIMQREGLQYLLKMKKRRPTGQPAQIEEHMLKWQFHVAPFLFFQKTFLGSKDADNEICFAFNYICPWCSKWMSTIFPKIKEKYINTK